MSGQVHNDLLLRALLRQPVPRTPVWLMRQAGRYLPEYRAVRARAGDFLRLCKTPELACEVTLQPLDRFSLDAAILFSDILTIPDAMGLGLYFVEGEGPGFERPLRTAAQIERLAVPDPETELRYVPDTVRLVRRELNGRAPLIGFAGSPWTLATYMVEGGPSKSYRLVKGMLYRQPALMHALLAKIADAVTVYLNAQVAAGAQALMVFDTWGGMLTGPAYQEFSLRYMKRIFANIVRASEGRRVPVILFTKGSGQWLEAMAGSGCDALGVDWSTDLQDARSRVGDQVALQGNMDPCVLFASPDGIRREVGRLLADYGKGSGHVFNLGHGILPEADPEHVQVMIEAVRRLSPAYHD